MSGNKPWEREVLAAKLRIKKEKVAKPVTVGAVTCDEFGSRKKRGIKNQANAGERGSCRSGTAEVALRATATECRAMARDISEADPTVR